MYLPSLHKLLLLITLLLATISTPAFSESSIRLNFGVYSSTKPSAMVKVYKPILKELERLMSVKLGRTVDIRMQIAKDYDQGISHLINGRVDFSAFGPASYVEAKRMNKNISILAVEHIKNSKVFYGIIAVAKNSPIKSISELEGKSFAFGDEGSTIGRFLSQLELEQAGIHATDLNRYEYLGRHDKVGTAVGAGSFDAGALNEKTFKKLIEAGENIRELVRFSNVTRPWIARSGLTEEVLQALRGSLLQVDNPATIASLKIDGFMEGSDDDYKVIRKAMETNQAFFAEHTDESRSKKISRIAAAQKRVAEPQVKAAIASQPTMGVTNLSTGTLKTLDTVESTTPYMNSRFVTVNIVLPRNLFDSESGHGHKSFTINLTIPESTTVKGVQTTVPQ